MGTVVGEGVGVRDDRGGAVTCVVSGVWLASERESTASSIQRQWRQRRQGRRRRLAYSGDGGREGVGSVRGVSSNGNGSEGVGGFWGDSGDGNGRRVRRPVIGGVDGGVRDYGGKVDGGRWKRAREVSGSKGGRVERFSLSAFQVSEIVILVCYGCNFGQTM